MRVLSYGVAKHIFISGYMLITFLVTVIVSLLTYNYHTANKSSSTILAYITTVVLLTPCHIVTILQEHLIKNRPDFIDSAEYRRHVLLNSKQDRETMKDDIKIKFLEENAPAFRYNSIIRTIQNYKLSN